MTEYTPVQMVSHHDGVAERCILHKTHEPVSIVQELHHVFPLALQTRIWPDVEDTASKAHDTTRVPICATGHNSVHAAITRYLDDGVWPGWCIGPTRVLAQEAITRYETAKASQ